MSATPFWVTAFLDLEAAVFEETVAFWSAVTGYATSPLRGDHDEFATLVPPDGDDFLRVQRLTDGVSRVHLDLHVDDLASATDRAVALGARQVVRHRRGWAVLTSPAGLTFCLVTHPCRVRPAPASWPGGGRSLVDQVCLDIAPGDYDAECGFWRDLTGTELRQASAPEMRALVRPTGQPLRFLLQRVGDDRSPATAHLDLACDDRAAETERHVGLGARVLRTHGNFTVLADLAGSPYCLTDRDPDTGLLAPS